ncbi:MAG: ABC transporter permease [Anderseniella sp.]|jgi:ABC-2 type transport system permease protein|nr:ABC transporter permease [Anderseniella sp.]
MTMLFQEALHQLKLFARRPVAMFFVIAMPLMLLLVLTQLFGNERIEGLGLNTAQFYTPALAVFGVVMACYTYLAVSTATARDLGILKRIRGTPMPPWVYICARILAVSVIAFTSLVLVIGTGALVFGVEIIWDRVPAAIIVAIAGALCFAALGMMITALFRSSETVQAATSATIMPLAFISDIFVRPNSETSEWIPVIGNMFPLRHFSVAFQHAFDHAYEGSGFALPDSEGIVFSILPHLGVMALWGIGAAFIAARFFNWDTRAS